MSTNEAVRQATDAEVALESRKTAIDSGEIDRLEQLRLDYGVSEQCWSSTTAE